MKKFGTILAALFFITLSTVGAISLSELQDNPEKYLFVNSNQIESTYIDRDSIKEIRAEEPYFVINAECYTADYINDGIMKSSVTYLYDSKNPDKIYMHMTGGEMFDFDGKPKNAKFYMDVKKPLQKDQESYKIAQSVYDELYK